MKKTLWIVIAIIILLIVGFFILKGIDKPSVTEIDGDTQADISADSGYKNLNTDNEVFEAIDESLELLE